MPKRARFMGKVTRIRETIKDLKTRQGDAKRRSSQQLQHSVNHETETGRKKHADASFGYALNAAQLETELREKRRELSDAMDERNTGWRKAIRLALAAPYATKRLVREARREYQTARKEFRKKSAV